MGPRKRLHAGLLSALDWIDLLGHEWDTDVN